MFHFLFYLLTKTTAVPVELLFFKRKTYYEDKKQRSRHLKGGALYVSNHRSFFDYLCYFFLVYFQKLRPVVSQLIYHKNPVMHFLLKMCGAIVVGGNEFDLGFMDKCVSLLRQGKKIIIFPEAHFNSKDEIRPFSCSFAKIALEADVPIIPLYINGAYSLFRRTRVCVGRKIYPNQVCSGISDEEVKRLAKLVEDKVRYLSTMCKRRQKTPLICFRHFPMDLGRTFGWLTFAPFFRTKYHPKGDVKSLQAIGAPIIVACNHRDFVDPVVLITSFSRRRMSMLVAKEVFGEEGEHKLRKKALTKMGCIKIDRESFDIEAINACKAVLESGRTLAIFPEGHLSHSGDLAPMKDGTAMLSCLTQAPILPLYLCASKGFLSKKHVYVGSLIYPDGVGMASIKKVSSSIFEAFESLKAVAIEEGREHE